MPYVTHKKRKIEQELRLALIFGLEESMKTSYISAPETYTNTY